MTVIPISRDDFRFMSYLNNDVIPTLRSLDKDGDRSEAIDQYKSLIKERKQEILSRI